MISIENFEHQVTLPDNRIVTLNWSGATDQGHRRETNQDSFYMGFPLFTVADGMGGHAGGEIASGRTIARLSELATSGSVSKQKLEDALELVVADLAAHPEATDEGTGTTVTGMFFDSSQKTPHWTIFNIGDSRVYLQRGEAFVQLTTDHSVVQELIDSGQLDPQDAHGHPYSNVITRAVGVSDLYPPDYVAVEVADGDVFVMCSDGLTKEITDFGVSHFLLENPQPPAAVAALINSALENGGRDNVTVIVLQVSVAEPA